MATNDSTTPHDLYGAKLFSIYPWQDYIFNVKEKGQLEIVYIAPSYPTTIAFADNDRGPVYMVKAVDAVKSDNLLSRLSQDDQLTVKAWGEKKQTKPTRYKAVWVAENPIQGAE